MDLLGGREKLESIVIEQKPERTSTDSDSIAETKAAVQGLRNQISSAEGFPSESIMGKVLEGELIPHAQRPFPLFRQASTSK